MDKSEDAIISDVLKVYSLLGVDYSRYASLRQCQTDRVRTVFRPYLYSTVLRRTRGDAQWKGENAIISYVLKVVYLPSADYSRYDSLRQCQTDRVGTVFGPNLYSTVLRRSGRDGGLACRESSRNKVSNYSCDIIKDSQEAKKSGESEGNLCGYMHACLFTRLHT
jgi:hypothetical protein